MTTDVLEVVVTRASVERARVRMAGRFASSVQTVPGTVLADGLALVDGMLVQAAVSGDQAGRSISLQNVGRPAAAYYVPYGGGEGGASALAGGVGNGVSVSGSSPVAPGVRLALSGDGPLIETVWPLIGGGLLTHALRLAIDEAVWAQRVVNEDLSDLCDGVAVEFALLNLARPGMVQVWVNGLLQRPGRDFVEIAPDRIQMGLAPAHGDDLLVAYEIG